MAPATPGARNGSVGNGQVGPHPSFIQVANPYIFEQKLQDCFTALGTNMAKEDRIRLDGVLWIDSVRKALQLWVCSIVWNQLFHRLMLHTDLFVLSIRP